MLNETEQSTRIAAAEMRSAIATLGQALDQILDSFLDLPPAQQNETMRSVIDLRRSLVNRILAVADQITNQQALDAVKEIGLGVMRIDEKFRKAGKKPIPASLASAPSEPVTLSPGHLRSILEWYRKASDLYMGLRARYDVIRKGAETLTEIEEMRPHVVQDLALMAERLNWMDSVTTGVRNELSSLRNAAAGKTPKVRVDQRALMALGTWVTSAFVLDNVLKRYEATLLRRTL